MSVKFEVNCFTSNVKQFKLLTRAYMYVRKRIFKANTQHRHGIWEQNLETLLGHFCRTEEASEIDHKTSSKPWWLLQKRFSHRWRHLVALRRERFWPRPPICSRPWWWSGLLHQSVQSDVWSAVECGEETWRDRPASEALLPLWVVLCQWC